MIYRTVIAILFLSLLAACAPAADPNPVATVPPDQNTPATAAPSPYPMPATTDGSGPKNLIAYPSPLDPLPDENNMTRGEAFVDVSDLVSQKSNPIQLSLHVSGSLPTPCNALKASLKGPDEQNRIQVELYSLVQADKMCAQVLVPFDTNIPLDNLKSGKYTVLLNGKEVGEIQVP